MEQIRETVLSYIVTRKQAKVYTRCSIRAVQTQFKVQILDKTELTERVSQQTWKRDDMSLKTTKRPCPDIIKIRHNTEKCVTDGK